ncbi:tyrosine-type recombinase/integrase [Paenibacillus frigoriresistens]|uniref:tyrosine-type recombinase/integrase n=1 Tax=Paenibacillus alginolyticus TaxID=59839 RepID=UPI001564B480|nr:tyrosine-type recombinase/integrase [Paenibacillus frigoriresistens]NRF93228.1 tyrosine-type recombinase/integrase [Paenibacillus frigoriresistens]
MNLLRHITASSADLEVQKLIHSSLRTGRFIYRQTNLDSSRVFTIATIDCDGIEIPHPISDFLSEYRGNSMSMERERQAASLACQFLNYVRDMTISRNADFTQLVDQGLFGLNFIHGSRFLDHQDDQVNNRGERVKRDTVDRKEYILTNFYSFFQKKGVISQSLIIPTYHNEKGQLVEASPFKRKRSNAQKEPVRKDLRDFGENRQQILVEFIDTAKSMKWGKIIALGLATQGFGGVRRGEVVNLTIGSVMQIGKSLIVNVQDRQNHLFAHKKNTAKEQVKKKRKQDLLPSNYLINLYEEHLSWLKEYTREVKPLVKDALFINRFGRPLTGKSYEKMFKRIVERYLKVLLAQGRYNDYTFLTSKPFNTHTLRGVYTNICLDDLGMSERETANARGDADENTVAEYLEELTAKKKMERAIGQLTQAVIDAETSKDFIKKMNMKDMRL